MAGRKNGGGGHDIPGIVFGVVCVCVALALIAGSGTAGDALSLLGLHGVGSGSVSAGADASRKAGRWSLPDASAGADASTAAGGLWSWLGVETPQGSGASASAGSSGGADASASGDAQATQSTQQAQPDTSGYPTAATDVTVAQAMQELPGVTIAQADAGGYNRADDFGGWAKQGTVAGCTGQGNTRDLILARDLADMTLTKDCHVSKGTLQDPYTGTRIAFTRGKDTSTAVQIDHVVALQDAWASGARSWSQERRVEYANSPDVLLAVQGEANEDKGAGLDYRGKGKYGGATPDIWLPSNAGYQCSYMAKRVHIKVQWGLSMTQREHDETAAFLAACPA